jgi:hypothetical protein
MHRISHIIKIEVLGNLANLVAAYTISALAFGPTIGVSIILAIDTLPLWVMCLLREKKQGRGLL